MKEQNRTEGVKPYDGAAGGWGALTDGRETGRDCLI